MSHLGAPATYAVVYYLVNGQWNYVDEGWNLNLDQVVYNSPVFPVFVWWWTGTGWTSEVVYDNAKSAGALGRYTGVGRAAGLGAAVTGQDVSTILVIGLEIAVVVGALYGFYLLVRKR